MQGNNELLHVSFWLALAGFAAPALAAPPDWTPVDAEQLEQMRGGFGNAAGLTVALGIERLVSINGEIVARTHIDIADLQHLTAEQARQTHDALSSVKLIQNGRDNIYDAGAAARVAGGVVIQNTLNDQLIRSETVISSTVNSASLLKNLNFQGTLSDALSRAAGAR
ncbi:hypothetical protein CR105_27180 [Massilia eurypsychrophila]|jgi:hypothetical protein|uniref:Uncharacterized protein n=1 Tax=Massilia eurypsychrophila TaxID=1485217 RepID=A0A2G8T8C3_9BURK|nr:hypothetical protein [Massilia eurypsychrophila]PIL41908.1 hypothetical protein CR105_27180 [Massilia eurypsychrophila]